MNEFPSVILPENVSEIANSSPIISKGNDAVVYRVGSQTLKKYTSASHGQIELYQDATQQTAEILNGREISWARGALSLHINPITKIIVSSTDKRVYTLNPFVSGINPQDLLNQGQLVQKDFNTLEFALDSVSVDIMKQLPYTGIRIIPWNILFTRGNGNMIGVVTDVSWRVKNLQRRENH